MILVRGKKRARGWKNRLLLLGSQLAVAAFLAADFAAATGFEGHAVFLILDLKGARMIQLRRPASNVHARSHMPRALFRFFNALNRVTMLIRYEIEGDTSNSTTN